MRKQTSKICSIKSADALYQLANNHCLFAQFRYNYELKSHDGFAEKLQQDGCVNITQKFVKFVWNCLFKTVRSTQLMVWHQQFFLTWRVYRYNINFENGQLHNPNNGTIEKHKTAKIQRWGSNWNNWQRTSATFLSSSQYFELKMTINSSSDDFNMTIASGFLDHTNGVSFISDVTRLLYIGFS